MPSNFVFASILRGKLGDLTGRSTFSVSWRRELEGVFRGENGGNETETRHLVVPAADTGSELRFNDREMLSRFALVPIPAQSEFLRFLRRMMAMYGVREAQLEIEWSKKKTRVLQIKIGGEYDGPLDLFLF